jgi:antitoxin component of RelBE/YafQ-DinJ toxin-antitoxin module
MNTGQIQLRLTLTEQLYEFLQAKAARLGLPVTQVVKHMIIKEAEKEEFPVFPASVLAEQKFNEVQSKLDGFVKVDDVKKYLDSL